MVRKNIGPMWDGVIRFFPERVLPTTSQKLSEDFPKSKLIQKLEAENRDIYKEYISFRCYKGKVVPSIERRRKVEYLLLFEE